MGCSTCISSSNQTQSSTEIDIDLTIQKEKNPKIIFNQTILNNTIQQSPSKQSHQYHYHTIITKESSINYSRQQQRKNECYSICQSESSSIQKTMKDVEYETSHIRINIISEHMAEVVEDENEDVSKKKGGKKGKVRKELDENGKENKRNSKFEHRIRNSVIKERIINPTSPTKRNTITNNDYKDNIINILNSNSNQTSPKNDVPTGNNKENLSNKLYLSPIRSIKDKRRSLLLTDNLNLNNQNSPNQKQRQSILVISPNGRRKTSLFSPKKLKYFEKKKSILFVVFPKGTKKDINLYPIMLQNGFEVISIEEIIRKYLISYVNNYETQKKNVNLKKYLRKDNILIDINSISNVSLSNPDTISNILYNYILNQDNSLFLITGYPKNSNETEAWKRINSNEDIYLISLVMITYTRKEFEKEIIEREKFEGKSITLKEAHQNFDYYLRNTYTISSSFGNKKCIKISSSIDECLIAESILKNELLAEYLPCIDNNTSDLI